MKILLAGNMVNLGYATGRQLRKDGIEADLLMEKNPIFTSDPLDLDSSLNNQYPKWITFYDRSKFSWKISVLETMRDKKYDLIHAYVELPIFAYLARRPYIAYAQGSDFRELIHTNSIRGILLRKAYRKAKLILFSQPDHLPLFSKLKLKEGIFLPIVWDPSFFSIEQYAVNQVNERFTIFHPANLDWNLKGNDILIKGFTKFIKNNPDSLLIIVDRGIDSDKTHNLVSKLAIDNKVRFVKGPLNHDDLFKFYTSSDVIADQFKVGSIGSICLETMFCKKPLISYIAEQLHQTVYGEKPPLANAYEPDMVAKQLEKMKDAKLRTKMGEELNKWVTKYHSPQIISEKLRKIYEGILNGIDVEQIKETCKY